MHVSKCGNSLAIRLPAAIVEFAGGGTINVQVLNEIVNVARRKMDMSWVDTRDFLSMVCGLLKVEPVTIEIHDTGIHLAERYGLSFVRRYDSLRSSPGRVRGKDGHWTGRCNL